MLYVDRKAQEEAVSPAVPRPQAARPGPVLRDGERRARVAEAHHARRSREASLEAPPRLHLRIHRFSFQRRHRTDDPRGRPPMARAPRGEEPEVRLPGPGGVEVGHRVRVAAVRDVLVCEQERHEEAGARCA